MRYEWCAQGLWTSILTSFHAQGPFHHGLARAIFHAILLSMFENGTVTPDGFSSTILPQLLKEGVSDPRSRTVSKYVSRLGWELGRRKFVVHIYCKMWRICRRRCGRAASFPSKIETKHSDTTLTTKSLPRPPTNRDRITSERVQFRPLWQSVSNLFGNHYFGHIMLEKKMPRVVSSASFEQLQVCYFTFSSTKADRIVWQCHQLAMS